MGMKYIGILYLNLCLKSNGEIKEILILIIDVTAEINSNIIYGENIEITRRIFC